MENEYKKQSPFIFHGEGAKLFGITILNTIFTILTLGLYYPWAKVAKLHYLYHETEFSGSRFEFHGKGAEVFKGFIKALGIVLIVYLVSTAAQFSFDYYLILLSSLFSYTVFAFLVPIAIHGSARYRLSRTSWRGIHFGYRGNRSELIKLFIIGSLLSIVTFGIYYAWLAIKIKKYVVAHTRFGSVSFSYHGNGLDYLFIHLKGYFLTFITFGIYFPWFMKNRTNYYINNIQIHQAEKTVRAKSNITGGDYFVLLIVNFFLVLFTFGLATPWATVRTMRLILSNIELEDNIDTENILQTEEDYKNATGEDLADMLDIDLI